MTTCSLCRRSFPDDMLFDLTGLNPAQESRVLSRFGRFGDSCCGGCIETLWREAVVTKKDYVRSLGKDVERTGRDKAWPGWND